MGTALFGQTTPDSYYREGLSHLGAREVEKARAAFQKAYDLQADIPDLYPRLAALMEAKGDASLAAEILTAGALRYQNDAAIHSALGRLHFNSGDLAGSVAALGKAVELAPDNTEYREQLSAALYRKSAEEYERRNHEESLSLSRQGLELRLNEAEFRYLKGINLLALKELTAARESLQRAITLSPGRGPFYYYLGIVLFEADDQVAAAENLEKAVKLDPKLPHARVMLGRVYGRLERVHDAIAEFKECLKLDSAFPRVHYYLGLAYRNLGEFDAAVSSFQKAIFSDPAHLPARLALTDLLVRQERFNQAIRLLDHSSVNTDPASGEVLYLKAKALVGLSRHEDAATVLEKLLQVEPGSKRAHYLTAQNYGRSGQLDLARKHQQIVRELAAK